MTFVPLRFERAFRTWVVGRGMGWEEVSVTLPSGGEVCRAYRLTPAGTPARAVLALHGAGNDSLFGWVGLFKELLLADTIVHTFDLPGHGRVSQTLFDIPRAREGIDRALTDCHVAAKGTPVHALGVSLGGSLLLGSLPDIEARLASAALVVAPLDIELSLRSILPEIGARTVALLLRERQHYGLTGLIPSFGPFKRETYPLRLAARPPPGPFGYIEALNESLESLKLEDAARRVELPVLLAYGDRDRVVPLAQGERIARALRECELLRVEGGTHLTTPLAPIVRKRILEWMRKWE